MLSGMGERPKFGIDTSPRSRHSKTDQPTPMFTDGTELPLFSGTPIPATERPFVPEDHSMKQLMLPDIPPVDYDHVLEKDRTLRRRTPPALPPAEDIFTAAATTTCEPPKEANVPATPPEGVFVPPTIVKERRSGSRER